MLYNSRLSTKADRANGTCKTCLWAWDDSIAHDIAMETIPEGKYLCCCPEMCKFYHQIMDGKHKGCICHEKRH